MAEKTVQEQISELSAKLDDRIATSVKEVKENIEKGLSDKMNPEIKKEIKALSDEWASKNKELTDSINELDAKIQKGAISASKAQETFESLLVKGLSDEAFQNSWNADRKGNFTLDLVGKAVGTMGEAASFGTLTGEVIAPDRRSDIVELVQRRTHIRSLLPQGTMTSNAFRFNQETVGEGGVDVTAEGAKKNQVDYNLEAVTVNPEKITGFVDITMELLDDIPVIANFITRRLTKDIRTKEDQQLLYGSGSSNQLTGLNANAAAFSAALPADANATIIDLMIEVAAQQESLNYETNGIVLNPRQYYQLYRAKSTTGEYVLNELLTMQGGQLFIAGIPVFRNTAVTSGRYIAGDWINGAQILDRSGIQVRFSEENNDNFEKNIITVRAEERLAFPIYYPSSFVEGDITTDIAKIKNIT